MFRFKLLILFVFACQWAQAFQISGVEGPLQYGQKFVVLTDQGESVQTTALFDGVESSTENGRVYDRTAIYEVNRTVVAASTSQDGVWAKPSTEIKSWGSYPMKVCDTGPKLKIATKYSYCAEGYKSYLGWPLAMGGLNNDDDNAYLYVSWWLWMDYDPRRYYIYKVEDFTGGFSLKEGDYIQIEGVGGAEVIGFDSDGNTHLNLDDVYSLSKMDGARITNSSSPGSAFLSRTTRFLPHHNKYIRVWEDPDGNEGVRLSWTNYSLAWQGIMVWVNKPEYVFPEEKLWNHMELFVDANNGIAETYVNGVKQAENIDPDIVNHVISGSRKPTVALLGIDGKHMDFQRFYMDNIFVSEKFSRFLVSNDEVLSQGSVYEPATVTSVSGGLVEMRALFGAVEPGVVYLHYVNSVSPFGSRGVPFCYISCLAKGAKPALDVQ